jgi:hypothetical protein
LERMREEALMAYFEVLTLTFAWRDWVKPRKISFGLVGLQPGIWNRDLPNTKHECTFRLYPSSKL